MSQVKIVQWNWQSSVRLMSHRCVSLFNLQPEMFSKNGQLAASMLGERWSFILSKSSVIVPRQFQMLLQLGRKIRIHD